MQLIIEIKTKENITDNGEIIEVVIVQTRRNNGFGDYKATSYLFENRRSAQEHVADIVGEQLSL